MKFTGSVNERIVPLFNGEPTVIRLINGQDVIAVVYQVQDSDHATAQDSRTAIPHFSLVLERPLLIERTTVSSLVAQTKSPPSFNPAESSEDSPPLVYVVLMEWMRDTKTILYPISASHVISFGAPSDAMTGYYWSDVEQVYTPSSQTHTSSTESSASPSRKALSPPSEESLLPDGSTREEVINSYLDFFLHNFKPNGKPH